MGIRIEDDGCFGIRFVFDKCAVDFFDDSGKKLFGFFLVEDGEVGTTFGGLGVTSQDALGDGVEGAAPELSAWNAGEILDALEHFLGGFIGESEQEDVPGFGTLVEEPGNAVGEGASFSGAGTSQN